MSDARTEYYENSENIRPESMERITTRELADKFIEEQIEKLRAQIGDGKVLLALSGGVDSSVVAALLIKAVGKEKIVLDLSCRFTANGYMVTTDRWQKITDEKGVYQQTIWES